MEYTPICDTCRKPCTLEDIPAHTERMEDRLNKLCNSLSLEKYYDKNKISFFIKSELERRDKKTLIDSIINNTGLPLDIRIENDKLVINNK